MALLRIRPSRADIEIAEQISDRTSPEVERIAEALTWGADEHVMCALAAGWWLYCRHRSPRHRTDSNHILLTTVAVTLLPHFLKSIFDQKRPDRLMIRGTSLACRFREIRSTPFHPAMPSMSARWHRPLRCCRLRNAIWSGRSARAWS